MRRSTVLGVAICAAIAFTCIAAGSASATVLCSKQVNPCGASTIGLGVKIKAALPALTVTVIENEFGNVTCLENQIGMKITGEGGEGISTTVKVTEFFFAQCTRPIGGGMTENCAVTKVNYGATEPEWWSAAFQAEKAPNGNGIFGISGSTLGSFGFYVVCGTNIDCTLTIPTGSKVTGGPGGLVPPTITGVEVMKNMAGKKCPPNPPTWRFTWAVSEPAALFVEGKK